MAKVFVCAEMVLVLVIIAIDGYCWLTSVFVAEHCIACSQIEVPCVNSLFVGCIVAVSFVKVWQPLGSVHPSCVRWLVLGAKRSVINIEIN